MTKIHRIGGVTAPRRHVVFIHGLGGRWDASWKRSPETFWLEWLIEDIDNLAVWSIEYDAPFTRWRSNCMGLPMRGSNIAQALLAHPDLLNGAICFVAHSLGGLVVKQLIRHLDGMRKSSRLAANFLERTDKVVFMGTPHAGAGMANFSDRLSWFIKPSGATASLLFNDPHLAELNVWYRNFSVGHIEHMVLTETRKQRLFAWVKREIVLPVSADPGILGADPIPVDADHENLCKPVDKADFIYQQVSHFIQSPRNDLLLGAENVDKIAGRINRFLNLRQAKINIGQSRSPSIEIEAAKFAMLRQETNFDDTDDEINESGTEDEMARIEQLKNLGKAADAIVADSRLVATATQALAIAEAGLRRNDKAMAQRGIEHARCSLEGLTDKNDGRVFLRERLNILINRIDSHDWPDPR